MSSDVNDVSSVFTITFTDFVIAPSFSHLDRVNKIFLVLCFVVMMINDHWSYTHITRILKEFGCQDVSEQEFQSFFNNFRRVWSGNRAVAFSQGGGRGFSFWQRFSKLLIQTFLVNSQTESLYLLERTASGVTRSLQAAAQSTARSFSRSVLSSSQR